MPSTQSVSVSATTTPATTQFSRAWSLLLRCPTANTDDIFVNLGGVTATTGDVRIRSGETISIDISPVLLAKVYQGIPLYDNDFVRSLSVRSNSGAQTLYFDVLRWDA